MFKSFHIFVVAVVLCLSACAPRIQTLGKENQLPQLHETFFQTKDGIKLPFKNWGNFEAPDKIIIALHGFNDYSNAFKTFGPLASNQNILTIAYDQRGFGATNDPGIWAGSNQFVQDLISLTYVIKQKYPQTPLYWMGESMGGAISIIASKMVDDKTLQGIILIAPAVWGWRHMNIFQAGMLYISAHILPWMNLTGDGLSIKPSDNDEMLRELGADPLVLKGARIDALYGLVSLMEEAHLAAEHLKHPTLFLYGAKDQLVPKTPTRETLGKLPRAPHGKWDVLYYKNGYHMLIRDLKGEKVIKDILAWIHGQEYPSLSTKERDIVFFNSKLTGEIPPLRSE